MELFVTDTGQKMQVHDREEDCALRGCVIHCPTVHLMSEMPLHWNGMRKIMERLCPHGLGHPDPDTLFYHRLTSGADEMRHRRLHVCDGCCDGAYERLK